MIYLSALNLGEIYTKKYGKDIKIYIYITAMANCEVFAHLNIYPL